MATPTHPLPCLLFSRVAVFDGQRARDDGKGRRGRWLGSNVGGRKRRGGGPVLRWSLLAPGMWWLAAALRCWPNIHHCVWVPLPLAALNCLPENGRRRRFSAAPRAPHGFSFLFPRSLSTRSLLPPCHSLGTPRGQGSISQASRACW
jgi:hypothetical protein